MIHSPGMNKLLVHLYWLAIIGSISNVYADWVSESNRITKDYMTQKGAFFPEEASRFGLSIFEINVFNPLLDPLPKFKEEMSMLKKLRVTTQDNKVANDIDLLINNLDRVISTIEVEKQSQSVSYFSVSKFVFEEIRFMLDSKTTASTKENARIRFRNYVSVEDEKNSLAVRTQSFLEKQLQTYRSGSRTIYLRVSDVNRELAQSQSQLKDLRDLFKKNGLMEKDPSLDSVMTAFEIQVKKYDAWTKKTFVDQPKRFSSVLPVSIYKLKLKQNGIYEDPESLVKLGKDQFRLLQMQFLEKAKQVAKINGWSETDAIKLIQKFRTDQLTDPEEIRQKFIAINDLLEGEIKKDHLMQLPAERLDLQAQTEAETKSVPFPNLVRPPLINNNGEMPVYKYPVKDGRLDLFFPVAFYPVTAREARPGYDMQFRRSLARGVSDAQNIYGREMIHTEGWGSYSEELMYPYYPPESQLVSLQVKMWKAARVFLDASVNLYQTKQEDVTALYSEQVGLTEETAQEEYDQYSLLNPGQAPTNYLGLLRIRGLKEKLKLKYAQKFTEYCFNEQFLDYGFISLDTIEKEMMKDFNPNCEKRN